MSATRSLRGRLALIAVLVTAGWLVVLTAGFNLLLGHELRRGADDLLHTRAAAAVSTVRVAPDGTLTIREPPDDRSIEVGTWIYQGSRALQRPTVNADEQRRADTLVGAGTRTVQTAEPDAVRYYAVPVRLHGRTVGTVVSSVSLDPYDRVRELALVASVGLAAVVLAGAYLLTRSLVGRALTPVGQMTEQAARWSEGDLERRFGPGRRPRELETLATTLDGVLDRLAAALRHEQQLSAELSHELRNPLAAVIAETDLLAARPRSSAELASGLAAILAAAERMNGVLESLLTAARATAGTAPGRCEVLPAVRAAVASIDPPPGVVAVREPAVRLAAGVDRALLERALAPVLDNAVRHRRSSVVVDIAAGPGGPQVRVRDDGAGVPPELVHTLFEPGVSGNRRNGSGLGLALARRLARAGGGELTLESGGPGAEFVLTLPAA